MRLVYQPLEVPTLDEDYACDLLAGRFRRCLRIPAQ
jgi:hypothetical protein